MLTLLPHSNECEGTSLILTRGRLLITPSSSVYSAGFYGDVKRKPSVLFQRLYVEIAHDIAGVYDVDEVSGVLLADVLFSSFLRRCRRGLYKEDTFCWPSRNRIPSGWCCCGWSAPLNRPDTAAGLSVTMSASFFLYFFIKCVDHLRVAELIDDGVQCDVHAEDGSGNEDDNSTEQRHVVERWKSYIWPTGTWR